MSNAQESTKIGNRLRTQRRSLRMTLREVATSVGCSESMISKIEADKANPSLATLHKIVAALGTNMAHLFGETADCTVFQAGDRPVISFDGQMVKLERLVPDAPDRMLQANIHIIDVGGSSQGRISHEGEEMGYVLQGSIELTVGDSKHHLAPGDSFIFRSEQEHHYRNTGKETARLLWVNTPVTF
ncbi:MAG: cupin domain-containing protein [Rhodospirillales bacterium]|jgi:transcriptional regulator with XRE-family HTH domain|nr:cupin domain-containing protein [Rhodospirillales bacterium]